MTTINYQQPVKIVIGNVGSRADSFIPCKENFNVVVKPGDTVTLEGLKSFEGIYYKGQETENITVGITALDEAATSVNMEVGSYNSSAPEDEAFTPGAPYNVIANEDNFEVVGEIPYLPADPALGLVAGNRFTIRLANPEVTSDNLPSGTMIKITNVQTEGGYNEYTKKALENDLSLISVINVKKDRPIEIKVKWTDESEWVTYTYNFENAKFLAEGQETEKITSNLVVAPGKTIKITNEHAYKVDFVLYKQNAYKTVEANSAIELTGNTVGEVLYYLQLSDLKVELI